MSRTDNVLDLLTSARPARLDPPDDRCWHAAPAVSAIVAHAGHDRVRWASRTRVAMLTSVGTAAAAIVTTVALTGLGPVAGPHTARPVTGSSSQPAPTDAGRLLLVAAQRSHGPVPASGRYLVMRAESGAAGPVDGVDGPYTMLGKTSSETWLARRGTRSSRVISQWLGAVPAAPADDAAWRRHGSPAVVRVTKPKPAAWNTAPGTPFGNTVDGSDLFALGDRNVTQAELDALPTDPAALRDALLRRFTGGGGDMPTDREQWLFSVGSSLLIELPVGGEVRGAAYRMIAALPGVRGLGPVRDVRGRLGQAVAVVRDYPVIGRFEERLIFEPDTGRTLGKELRAVAPRGTASWLAPGALYTYQLVVGVEASDDDPPKVRG